MTTPIFVVMAVFRPDAQHLEAQLASIAAQRDAAPHLVAVIADAVSGTLVTETADRVGLPVSLVPSDEELDAVRAFEAGLLDVVDRAQTMDEEPLIALSDQDDIWHADRLSRGISALRDKHLQLVHSDARLVAGDGTTEIAPSMFRFERRKRKPGLRGLLYRNNITGMTLLMRLRVAQLAVPFPPQSGVHFYHDLWLGLIAAATGGIGYIDAPLVDYRQHGKNAIGAVDRQAGWLRGKPAGDKRRLPDKMWLRREAAAYALARYLAQSTHNRIVDAVADGNLPVGIAHLRPLRPYLRRTFGAGVHLLDAARLAATGHLALARIATGFWITSVGRTVWTLREALGPGRSLAIERFDERLFSLSPGQRPRAPQSVKPPKISPHNHEGQIDPRKSPRWSPDLTAPEPAFVVLVPTLNPSEIFAGIVTALDFGLGLAERGARVRFVATDLPVSSNAASRSFVAKRLSAAARAAGAGDRISIHCGVQSTTIPAHPGDVFLATAWWSAHLAETLIRRNGLDQSRFFYLIQDYEPNFYAWGMEYADAVASYGFDFEPIFNTTLLRDYFAERGWDFANPSALAFQPSIDVARYARSPRTGGGTPRRLALYGRPEVARNMYGTAVEALARFVRARDLGPDDIQLVSIGLPHAPLKMPNGLLLESLGKLPWEDYPGYLAGCDLGLSLMYSPHPSHPPIEMAASGMRVVTNTFGPKDLSRLSPAILSAEPEARALAAALETAWDMPPVTQAEREFDLGTLGVPKERAIELLAAKILPLLHKDAA
ncbi:rhamnosyltransferase WsaF family glycosyltransferase [Roseivivax sediminis]|uniref:Uncharacterized protein n=1 Tax=Roseivivax sediminis TaxID=936889 RepID=A0A1I2ACC2_9RHOB|nr:glycosyl transferase family 1 [Roseivivax sediminis]SFE41522.1 hypothetical protein SAMN04515678_109175 [Roseivivax sediminis]